MKTRHFLQLIVSAVLMVTAVLASATRAQGPAPADVTLTGQVVCSACWAEADDRKQTPYGTQADLQCAVKCASHDVPRALAVWDGDKTTLYIMERGAYPAREPAFLDLVPRKITVHGPVRTDGDKHFIKVNQLKFEDAGAPSTRPAAAKPGDAAPPLELADLAGSPQSLAALRGKIVVLNFWATWCGPCRREMPIFSSIHSRYSSRGVMVVAASADSAETIGRVRPYVEQEKFPFAVWTGASPDDLERFGLPGVLPCTVVIDRDGKIAGSVAGMIDEQRLTGMLDAMLRS